MSSGGFGARPVAGTDTRFRTGVLKGFARTNPTLSLSEISKIFLSFGDRVSRAVYEGGLNPPKVKRSGSFTSKVNRVGKRFVNKAAPYAALAASVFAPAAAAFVLEGVNEVAQAKKFRAKMRKKFGGLNNEDVTLPPKAIPVDVRKSPYKKNIVAKFSKEYMLAGIAAIIIFFSLPSYLTGDSHGA